VIEKIHINPSKFYE
jgi:pre-mRNA-processing factor 17